MIASGVFYPSGADSAEERLQFYTLRFPLVEAAGQAKQTHVLFNNCYANYGATNALMLAELLQDLD